MGPISTDASLSRLLERGERRAAMIGPQHAMLWRSLAVATEGGKRFRPALLIASHDALGGGAGAAAADVGAALELLHTAFVIHDDVIDDDHVRRGRPNVSGTFRDHARAGGADPDQIDHYGRTAAILVGDLALSTAVRAVATCGAPADIVDTLLDMFDAALHTTAAGELDDVRLSLGLGEVTMAESLSMVEQKTSAYSFSLPLQAGAVLANAPSSTVDQLGEAGRAMGTAFQLIDDLIGVFGIPERTGKSSTSDLRSGKQTPLLVHARSTPEWAQIRAFIGRELDDDELSAVRSLLVDCGARRCVETLVEQQLAQARSLLGELRFCDGMLETLTVHRRSLLDGQGAAA